MGGTKADTHSEPGWYCERIPSDLPDVPTTTMASNANKGAHQIEKPNIVDSLTCRLSAELNKKIKR